MSAYKYIISLYLLIQVSRYELNFIPINELVITKKWNKILTDRWMILINISKLSLNLNQSEYSCFIHESNIDDFVHSLNLWIRCNGDLYVYFIFHIKYLESFEI